MARMPIDPDWLLLEKSRDKVTCPVCAMVLDEPTTACPEGHALCRPCYVLELQHRARCPTCRHPTDASKLQRCRPLEEVILELRLRCKHGRPDGQDEREEEGRGEGGGAAPRAKRAKLDEQGKTGEKPAPLVERRRSDAGEEEARWCSWEGMVCELSTHLAGTCGHEPVECPNAAAGCQESVMRKDAARHASEACAYRLSPCTHCRALFMARDLAEHEGICPEAQVECPNAGCGVTVARGSMAEHRGGCGREIVACPCPGCEERMVRAKVEEHVEASGAVHVRRAWRWAAEMEGTAVGLEQKVAEQGDVIVEQKAEIAMLQAKSALQAAEISKQKLANFGLQKRSDALTRVFTWSTDSSFVVKRSASYTFTDGVCGQCCNFTVGNQVGVGDEVFSMSFLLREGHACTMHYKCSILDKNDKVLRVVSRPESCDFQLLPVETAGIGRVEGAWFDLTEEDKAGAVREDGSIKLRMVVHLYLPE